MRFSSLVSLVTLAVYVNGIPRPSEPVVIVDAAPLEAGVNLNNASVTGGDILDANGNTVVTSAENLISARQSSDLQSLSLSAHNNARAQYGANALTWNQDLYADAQSWASACKFQHSSPGGKYGENLSAGTSSTFNVQSAVTSWVAEVSSYNYCAPGFSSSTGHFTQVVWKASTGVACATAQCAAGTIFSKASTFVVCRYTPPGNVGGAYAKNVGTPVGSSSSASCASSTSSSSSAASTSSSSVIVGSPLSMSSSASRTSSSSVPASITSTSSMPASSSKASSSSVSSSKASSSSVSSSRASSSAPTSSAITSTSTVRSTTTVSPSTSPSSSSVTSSVVPLTSSTRSTTTTTVSTTPTTSSAPTSTSTVRTTSTVRAA